MKAGPLRQRLALQSLSEAADGVGQMQPTWTTSGTYWGSLRNLSGREAVNAKQVRPTATHTVTLRYLGDSRPVRPSMRFLYEGRTFNIDYVNIVDGRNRELEILCTEVVAPATNP